VIGVDKCGVAKMAGFAAAKIDPGTFEVWLHAEFADAM